jgi:hypothetical protein
MTLPRNPVALGLYALPAGGVEGVAPHKKTQSNLGPARERVNSYKLKGA